MVDVRRLDDIRNAPRPALDDVDQPWRAAELDRPRRHDRDHALVADRSVEGNDVGATQRILGGDITLWSDDDQRPAGLVHQRTATGTAAGADHDGRVRS